jgi:undecaprenyl-diphosphatase
MSIFEAVFLGALQGVTEFLPVSSSGHLVLFQKILGIENPSLFFDVMLHIGTLASVLTALRKDIFALIKKPFQKLTLYITIATIPIIIAALLFSHKVEETFHTGRFLGFAFLVTSLLLAGCEYAVKKMQKKQKNSGEVNYLDAVVIGLFQALALVPGISRSGATLSSGLFRRLSRDFAARFAFLLSIPTILSALVYSLRDFAQAGNAEAAAGLSISAASIIAGTVTASVVGFFAVTLMIKIVRKKSLWGFAVYTCLLGILVLLDQFVLGIIF